MTNSLPARHPKTIKALGSLIVLLCASAQAADDPPSSTPPVIYQDRVIDERSLQPLPPDNEDDASENLEGQPRSVQIELTAGQSKSGLSSSEEKGVHAGGFFETSRWGTFSGEGSYFENNKTNNLEPDLSEKGGLFVLWQRNLTIGSKWHVDNGLGVLNTLAPPLERQQYRFFLPTVSFAGFSTEWTDSKTGLILQGSVGVPGIYTGSRITGFEVGDGSVASLGAEWHMSPQWKVGGSFLHTDGTDLFRTDPLTTSTAQPASDSFFVGTSWKGSRSQIQLNGLSSRTPAGSAQGFWVDAKTISGRYIHNYGLFHLAPDLAWGAFPINNNARGGYYRLSYHYGPWDWNSGLDKINAITDNGFNGFYGSTSLRYQASTKWSYGGALGVRKSETMAHNVQLFVNRNSRFGQTRLQLDEATNASDKSWQVSLDQPLSAKTGSRLSTSLSYGQTQSADEKTTSTSSFSLYGGQDLTDKISIDGSARWTYGQGPAAQRGLDMNVSANYAINKNWTLAATFYRNQGQQRSPFVLDPLAPENVFTSLPLHQSTFLTLRYSAQAGRAQGVLAGQQGGPVGSISGNIFLDDNKDDVRSASEISVNNITVVLDGLYSVRTDSMGHFEFPNVGAGKHTVVVMPDNLPLPWQLNDKKSTLQVNLRNREDLILDISAQRP